MEMLVVDFFLDSIEFLVVLGGLLEIFGVEFFSFNIGD